MNAPGALLLTFDVERFEIPDDLGLAFSHSESLRIARVGWERTLRFLRKVDVSATLFLTPELAGACPDLVRETRENGHEIALHYDGVHDRVPGATMGDMQRQVRNACRALRDMGSPALVGCRGHHMRRVPPAVLSASGLCYDSSAHPTYIPGRYNQLTTPRGLHLQSGILQVPVSVSPGARVPLSWVFHRLLPRRISRMLANRACRETGLLHLYFHNWELADLPRLGGARYRLLTRNTGAVLEESLRRLVDWARARRLVPQRIRDLPEVRAAMGEAAA